jgi:ATP-dependent DNA helicase PIF1
VDFRRPCFTHGQLYVALSRVTDVSRLSVLLNNASNNCTDNVVYPEALLEG